MEWNYLWVWIIMSAVFLTGEIFSAAFFLFWFGVSAGVTAIVSLFGVSPMWQLITFIVLSFLLLLISRPFAERISARQPDGIGANRFLGEHCRVLETIDPESNTGLVRMGQEQWRAESATGEVIGEGLKVQVTDIHGTRLVVSPIREDEE